MILFIRAPTPDLEHKVKLWEVGVGEVGQQRHVGAGDPRVRLHLPGRVGDLHSRVPATRGSVQLPPGHTVTVQ